MYLIDTHFHLDLYQNPADLLAKIEREKVYSIAVTNTPSVYHFTQGICENTKYIRPALGLHPELAEERLTELNQFKHLIKTTKYIGEIGLDNIKRCSVSSKLAQSEVFKKIIEICAFEKNKVLTIHSRGSEEEVLNIVGQNFPGKIILHWYSGSLQNLKRGLNYGCYFSVNSSMCKSKSGQKIIQNIPLSRLLTESDGPFIKGKSEINSPLLMKKTINQISRLLDLSEENISQTVYENFKKILVS
ncbi:Qat anti-phage system TatD family nuclease QatD [Marinoscillum sp.]|jgi:TatD DNase family protein|uniref:Qat anti-phage system TatD family nuclease QatD n=1 Tax=Marinoscillum sp. TaxID=2024838 RepID=UPI003BAB19B4